MSHLFSYDQSMDNSLKIIERIRNGDNEAFDELLNHHRNMIYSIINTFDLQYSAFKVDEADLFQEASMALYEAVFSYEDNRQTKFSTYAYIVIKSKLINYMNRFNRIYTREYLSIDSIIYREKYKGAYLHDAPFIYHRQNELARGIGRFINNLSFEDRMIVEMRSRKCSYKQIADKLKINTKKVDNRLSSIRKNLKCFLDEREFI